MIVATGFAERDAVPDAVLAVSNGDGTWTVYQTGDTVPEAYQYAAEAPENQAQE